MPKPLSVQLYTLRDAAQKDFKAVLKVVADIGYKGVELAGTYGLKPAEFKKHLNEYNLPAIGSHVGWHEPANAAAIIDDAKTLGYKHIVLSPPKEAFDTEDGVKKLAEKLNAGTALYKKDGLVCSLHNHYWEFKDLKHSDLLTKLCPDVYWQQDIYWVQVSGQDPVKNMERYANRTVLLHVKDGPADKPESDMTAVGKGKVDIAGCLKAAEKSKAEWYSVELDRCATDMAQAVIDSYNYLVGNGLAAGNKPVQK